MVENLRVYLKLFILLYADDTVIFSDNENDLQHALNAFADYCDTWKLKINVSKTKVMTISKGNVRNRKIFSIGNEQLENVDEYKYLGLFFTKNGSFNKTKKYIAEQANKAMFALLRKIKRLSLPYDLQLDLFEKTIKPILLYGSEVWGYGSFVELERIQLKFYKYVFHLKKATPSYMIYGELGVTPLHVDINNKTISFWSRIIENTENDQSTKLASKIYLITYDLHSKRLLRSPWFDNLKTILCNSGFSGIWYSQSFVNSKWLVKASLRRLKDIFIQNWHTELERTSNSNLYKYVKNEFHQAQYVKLLTPYSCKKLLAFLTRNHNLPIEIGRWQNIPADERKCQFCQDLGDEYHYLLECPLFLDERKKYISRYIYTNPSMIKLIELIQTEDKLKLKKLSVFCDHIMRYFKN